jgi:hypothetical protein
MEFTIFPKPEVSKELGKYVEVRLHMDANELKDAEKVHDYMQRVARSTGIPIYVIVDPDSPEKVIEKFNGYDFSGGAEFRRMLERNAKAR